MELSHIDVPLVTAAILKISVVIVIGNVNVTPAGGAMTLPHCIGYKEGEIRPLNLSHYQ